MTTAVGTVVELTLDGFAHGGSAVGRLPDGTACFVDYAIPGERVRVRVTERRRRWARADLVEVVEPSPDRVTPPCPLFGPGRCGGCKLQHIAPRRQADLLAGVISDQLQRIGRLDIGGPPRMLRPHDGDGMGYRQRARFAVDGAGHLAFRRAGSHDLIAVDDCPLLVPEARAWLRRGAVGWRGAKEVSLQVGTDGQAATAVTAARGRARPPRQVAPDLRSHTTFTIGGHTFRVGAASFFQASAAAAELLTATVARLTPVGAGDHVLELYAGVGLLTAALAAGGARVTAVEASAAACRDAATNLASPEPRGDAPAAPRRRTKRGSAVTVVHATAGPGIALTAPVDAVVLDPPRRGAEPEVIAWIAGLAPSRVTYVSCDPATFARDARTLVDRGYTLDEVVGIDQFTHSGHVELVAAFLRDGDGTAGR
jgi:tRNA/tmRNA/rRNA uracil-C5-methylase (TrmA/RlmC/RlmD family)